jgi:hypothetical protein
MSLYIYVSYGVGIFIYLYHYKKFNIILYALKFKIFLEQMTTTDVDEIIKKDYVIDSDDKDSDNLEENIMDMSRPLDNRIKALELFYDQQGDNAIEIMRRLSSMYQLSGSKLIERFFYRICTNCLISSFLKMEVAKALLDYEEYGDEDRAEEVKINNEERKILGYKAVNHVCQDLCKMPTPCRVEAIFILMKSPQFKAEADFYFKEFVRSDTIECEFRYMTILSLENVGAEEMKQELYEYSYDSVKTVEKICEYLKIKVGKEWRSAFRKLSYDDVKSLHFLILPEIPCEKDWFIKSAQMAFLFHEKNPVYYRNLSSQYLLKKCSLDSDETTKVETKVLEFADDAELDYNLRADSADILLRYGSDAFKEAGRRVIMELAVVNGNVRTIFENAQNVHTESVEESVSEILEFLNSLTIYMIDKNPVDFNYVNAHIEKMLKQELEKIRKDRHPGESCDSPVGENFCSPECDKFYYKNQKIKLSMQRILMDRALYSKFNNSLLNILLKVYSYIQTRDDESIKEELYKRMLEELEEMSGTCSSGFASRLVNIISGHENFNIRISFEDQIISNFMGRLNAKAREITNIDSIFRNEKVEDVVELWLLGDERVQLRKDIENECNIEFKKRPVIRDIIKKFLSEDREEKIENCIQIFSESVINEMMIKSSRYGDRRNFSLFFRTYASKIREELAEEFKEFVSDTDFDLWFRRAIMSYDGE